MKSVGARNPWLTLHARVPPILADSVARNTALLTVNGLLVGLGGLVFWFIAVRLYPVSTVGVATTGNSLVWLLNGLSFLGLGAVQIRYHASRGLDYRRQAAIIALPLVTIIHLSILGWWLIPASVPLLSVLFASTLDKLLFLGSAVGWMASTQFETYLTSQRQIGLIVLKNMIFTVSRLILLLQFSSLSPSGLVAVATLSSTIGAIAVVPVALGRIQSQSRISCVVAWRTLINYAFWNHLAYLAEATPPLLVPALIVSLRGEVAAAAYSMVWSFFGALLLIPSALALVLLAEQSADAKSSALASWLNNGRSNWLMLGCTALFIPGALLILALMGGSYRSEGWFPLVILACGSWGYYRTRLLITAIRLGGPQHQLTLAYTAIQLGFLASCILVVHIYGIGGAALAWTASQYCLLAWIRGRSSSWSSTDSHPARSAHREA